MPTVHRIGNKKYPLFDGGGAALNGGRWSSAGRHVIYAAEHFATAMLEILIRTRNVMPRDNEAIEITIPDHLVAERLDAAALAIGWDDLLDYAVARAVGDEWYAASRSAVLFVPSVVCRGEWNCLINAEHAEFRLITASAPKPVTWDQRLFV